MNKKGKIMTLEQQRSELMRVVVALIQDEPKLRHRLTRVTEPLRQIIEEILDGKRDG